MYFINPEELNNHLSMDDNFFLLIILDKRNLFYKKYPHLYKAINHVATYLHIMLMGIEYQNIVFDKFQIHGFPAFIAFENGLKKETLLGIPTTETFKEFIARNISNQGIAK